MGSSLTTLANNTDSNIDSSPSEVKQEVCECDQEVCDQKVALKVNALEMQERVSLSNQSNEEVDAPLHTSSSISIGDKSPSIVCPWLVPPWPPPKKKDTSPSDVITVDNNVVVCRVKSSSMLSVNILVGDHLLRAVVDTAAEVTIMSDNIYQSLRPIPPVIKNVVLNTAGRNMKMKGMIVGPVEMTLGKNKFSEFVYVAPIDDDMLLGVDLLRKHGAYINIPDSLLSFQGECVAMSCGEEADTVSQVVLLDSTTIPPRSVKRVKCNTNASFDQFLVEPDVNLVGLVPRTLHKCKDAVELYALNPTDVHIHWKRGQIVGEAIKVSVIEPTVYEPSTEKHVRQVDISADAQIPSHLQSLWERSSEHLVPEQQEILKDLLLEYECVFARDEFDLGNFTEITHPIDTGDAQPIKQKMRRTPMNFVQEERAHLNKMLSAGVIQPSMSEWASAPVLVRKRDGGVRWCIDYRRLNKVTKKDVYPLPCIEECLDTLAENTWFSKLDANSAYWQIKIRKEDREKTAFISKHGLFEFVRMSFGLCNAPATFSRVMNLVLRGLTWNIALAFLDDVVVLGTSFSDHVKNLRQVLERFRDYKLKLKPKKCSFFQQRVEFLGREVDGSGLHLKEEHVNAVVGWPTPTCTKEVEQFLGLVNYHRVFLKDCAKIVGPLYGLTGKNEFHWEEEHQYAFEQVKELMTTAPVLVLPNSVDHFILDTDASGTAIGAELIQLQEGQERVIAYGSLSLSPEQRRYCVTRRELLAVVRFTRQYRHYLLGKSFTVRTDHGSLTWLLNFKEPQGQVARWLEELGQYHMKIEHRPGRRHQNADALSRIPDSDYPCENYRLGVRPEGLPCGGCSYCQKAHDNWSHFVDVVDDVVPLARKKQISEVTVDSSNDVSYGITHMDVIVHEDSPIVFVNGVTIDDTTPSTDVDLTSSESLRKEQESDPQLHCLRRWLISKEEPDEGTIFLLDPTGKFFWINRDLFLIKDGIIWKKDDDKPLLVIPQSLRQEVIKLNHDLPSAGHTGINRTKGKLKSKYFWHGMTKDVQEYIRKCATCNMNKKAVRRGKHPLVNYHAGAPMERVHLDFLGPLPKTSQGNEHILMMVDQFTKWVECVPLPSQKAEVTAHAAVGEFFCRFGCPFQIFTDQGRNFESRLFTNVCKALQIHKARTTPYRPSSNGQVERFNRTLMDAVRCYIGKSQNQWDKFISQIAGAIRSSVNRSTGFTPNKLMLGREINLPADLVYPIPTPAPVSMEDYAANLSQSILQAHETARATLRSTQRHMKRDYDVKVHLREFKEGDRVYVLDTATPKGKSRKLLAPWRGPAVIRKKYTPYLYQVIYRNKAITMNHDRLKKCTDTSDLPKKQTKKDLYCFCKGPDDGSFMIQCDGCDEWFHGNCVGVTPGEGMLIDKYFCPFCKQKN